MGRLSRIYNDAFLVSGTCDPNRVVIGFARTYQYVLGRQAIMRLTPGESSAYGSADSQIVRITPMDIAAENNWYRIDYHGKGAFSFKREPSEPDTEKLMCDHGLLIATLETLVGQNPEQVFAQETLFLYGAPSKNHSVGLYRFDKEGSLLPVNMIIDQDNDKN